MVAEGGWAVAKRSCSDEEKASALAALAASGGNVGPAKGRDTGRHGANDRTCPCRGGGQGRPHLGVGGNRPLLYGPVASGRCRSRVGQARGCSTTMGWERGAYYRCRREGGKVVRTYVGTGPAAELAASLD